jgi:hypothetical protein
VGTLARNIDQTLLLCCGRAAHRRIAIRHDGLQARKQACRVASENGATFHIIQRRALQHVFGSCGKVSALVGKVCSVQNLIESSTTSPWKRPVTGGSPWCQPRISWAARPAIMWVEAFVPGPVMI